MTALSMFLTSNNGYVSQREGLSLGWLAGAVAGMAAFLGGTQNAAATHGGCFGIPHGQCGWICTTNCCDMVNYLNERWCLQANGTECSKVDEACNCFTSLC